MKKIAVILAGCGRMDGSEIHESVLTLLSIQQAGAKYQCFSLDLEQYHVINHLTNQNVTESRNMLIESARIARGDVINLANIDVNEFDGLIIPGGNGIAANLFSLLQDSENYTVNELVAQTARQFTQANKPVGFICIAPVMIPAIYDFPVNMTIGNDKATADLVEQRGAIHHSCNTTEVYVDEEHKIVTTPAYMMANSIVEAYSGINKLCFALIQLME
jgi:enhancing lycopene biosynthesis protein 2